MTTHHNANDLEFTIDPTQLKPLFKTNALRHAAAVLFNWLIIGMTIFLGVQYFHPLLYFFCVIVIGARMHALAILMHDATHFRFLKNRKWNDLVTNLVTTYPIFTSIEQYRENHLRHHRHLNTENDPDWVAKLTKREFTFPKTKQEFILTILSYLFLFQGIKDAIWFVKRFSLPSSGLKIKRSKKITRLVFNVIMLLSITVLGIWKYYLLFWIVPYLTTFFMFQYIRSVAEHFGELAYDHLLTSTRTVKVNWLEQFFIAPHHVGYHLEHHLYPAVPFYHLPKLHALLMSHQDYSTKAHVTHGYMRGLLQELGKVEVVVT